jgi:hypothetical protein
MYTLYSIVVLIFILHATTFFIWINLALLLLLAPFDIQHVFCFSFSFTVKDVSYQFFQLAESCCSIWIPSYLLTLTSSRYNPVPIKFLPVKPVIFILFPHLYVLFFWVDLTLVVLSPWISLHVSRESTSYD